MAGYVPHTPGDWEAMLAFLGTDSPETLFDDIPGGIRETGTLDIPSGISEYQALERMKALARKNRTGTVSFLGCGSYDHVIPAALEGILSRGEFLTAYTPYQAEISQGILQTIFEFQSMICELTGLAVSNASLYDGHTAAAEAAVMALNSAPGRDTILYSASLHPHTAGVLKSFFADLPVVLEEIPLAGGMTDRRALSSLLSPRTAGVILQSPNIFGLVENLSGLSEELEAAGSLFILSANPVSLGMLKSPGEWGARIAVGDLQPFGLSASYGGPSAGYIAAEKTLLRRLPGRISGQTLDGRGERAFVLTLQAREQHIKRARATSNICSNQALAAVASTVYMALLGRQGLEELAGTCAARARYLLEQMETLPGVRRAFPGPYFHEFTLELPRPAAPVLEELAEDEGILGGIDTGALRGTGEENLLTVAVTEKRSREEMDRYVRALDRILRGRNR